MVRSLVILLLIGPARVSVAGGASPQLEEREIVWQEAQQGGAQFPDPVLSDSSAGCRATTGMARSGGMLFALRCPAALGAHSTHPAYASFRLKNGWRVKETRVVVLSQVKGGVELDKPAPGGDLPFLKGRLWAGPGGDVLVEITVKVEGPKGTSYFK